MKWGFIRAGTGEQAGDALNFGVQGRAYPYAVVIDPQDLNTLYAVLGVVGGYGIFKSSDAEASWSAANCPVNSIVIDPRHPDTLYGIGNGVLRSTDGGATWSTVNTDLTTFAIWALTIDPYAGNTVYAGTAGGVFAITFAAAES